MIINIILTHFDRKTTSVIQTAIDVGCVRHNVSRGTAGMNRSFVGRKLE